jgi:hypothetical protein
MGDFPQNLQTVLSRLQKLPDDLVRKICAYANHRIDKDGNLIRLIDLEKYKFLEKVISRKMVGVSKVKIYDDNSGQELPTDIVRVEYELPNCCELPDRQKQSIQNDKMYLYLNQKTGHYTINKYRLKNEEFFKKDKPIFMSYRGHFPRGNYRDYDWEVFTIASDGSNQDV